MKTKFYCNLIISALFFGCTATYAATNASLWGTIDQPVPPIQQIEQEQQQLQAQQEAIANQKTICELLSAQPTLTTADQASASRIRDALSQAYKMATPDYKMFLVSGDAANTLYTKYRDLYMKTYCTAASNQ